MRKIFECVHGSQLFGTNVEGSDLDTKFVYVCDSLDEYMMKRGQFDTKVSDNGQKGSDKEEDEGFYIQEMDQKLRQMQTNNVSMVFAPRDKWLLSTPAWEDLVANRHRLVSKNVAAYAGYAKGQAQKYTCKGERLATAERFLAYVEERVTSGWYRGNNGKMTENEWAELLNQFVGSEGVELWTNKTGEELIRVVGKSFSKFTRVDGWLDPMDSLINKYGKRAKLAKEDGKDLKALLHAFRITREAKELLTTGGLVYPTPSREFYLKIRRNEFEYAYLQELLTEELEEMYALRDASTLPDEPDEAWLRRWSVDWQQHYWDLGAKRRGVLRRWSGFPETVHADNARSHGRQ